MNFRALIFLLLPICMLDKARANAAADASNALGIDLLRIAAPGGNALLSPFSLSAALTMTMGGAAGQTREEMANGLHWGKRADKAAEDFDLLRRKLADAVSKSAKDAAEQRASAWRVDPMQIQVANRLYGQSGFAFRPEFIEETKRHWLAPLETLDFRRAEAARASINNWVDQRTSGKIPGLIPAGSLSPNTRLVIVNALYFKAPWSFEFERDATRSLPFFSHGTKRVNVPTMFQQSYLGYSRGNGFTAVALDYLGSDVQMLILLPDARDGVAALMQALTPALFSKLAALQRGSEIKLWLPRFKFAPPTINVSASLQQLGMKSAFNVPRGSADFSNIALRTPTEYLAISNVFHRTFIAVDERGTEAAAATSGSAEPFGAPPEKPKPIEVRVDHPFIFAIQHRDTAVCLFLGRITHLQ